jgi:predicted Rossmann fold nucleotide-binding protein DprA/Smf involved in DNA uptake
MPLSAQAQAVLLLTAHLGRRGQEQPRHLSPREWSRLAQWLKDQNLQPESLLSSEPATRLAGWLDKTVTVQRIRALLDRGGALGLALERWERAGIWVITRSDPDYPERLKRRLSAEAPPFLFGCGNRRLLASGGLAIVGSREAAPADLTFAATLGAEASSQGISVVSGGARGIDEAAMLGALEHEGTTVGVLADSLLRAATSARYRKHLMGRDLVLVSTFNPEAGFEVGNAMTRNRYVYCLADAAVVVSSSRDRGGTWTGALENLKARWVPLWVKPSSEPGSGNAELERRGARRLPDGKPDLAALILGRDEGVEQPGSQPPGLDVRYAPPVHREESIREIPPVGEPLTLYELFLRQSKALLAATPLSLDQLGQELDLTKPQLGTWLKRAVAEGQIERLSRPVRYRRRETQLRQCSIFGDDTDH